MLCVMLDGVLTLFEERPKPRKGLRAENYGKLANALSRRLTNPNYQAQVASKKPQAILKVASFAKGSKARTLMQYVTRVGKDSDAELGFSTQDGDLLKGAEAVESLYEEWSKDFERKKRGGKREPRHVTHIILSADTDNSEKSAMKVNFAATDFLDEYLQEQGFEYLYVTHRDTDKPHVHVVVKNYNKLTGKKLHLSKEATFHMRQQWVKALEGRGVEAVATLRRDRVQVLENVANGIEDIKQKESWSDRIMLRSSTFSKADRKHLVGRVDGLVKNINGAEGMAAELKEKVLKNLSGLKLAVAEKSKQDVGRALGAIQNGVGRAVPEIRKELLSWVEGSKVPDMTLRQRKGLAWKVARMKEDVKATTLIFSKERREYMAALRKLDSSIRSKSKRDIARSAEAVVAKAGNNIESVKRHLKAGFLNEQGNAKATKLNLGAASIQMKVLLDEIKDAATSLQNGRVKGSDRKDLAVRLRIHLEAAKKLQQAIEKPKKLKQDLADDAKLPKRNKRLKGLARSQGKDGLER